MLCIYSNTLVSVHIYTCVGYTNYLFLLGLYIVIVFSKNFRGFPSKIW